MPKTNLSDIIVNPDTFSINCDVTSQKIRKSFRKRSEFIRRLRSQIARVKSWPPTELIVFPWNGPRG